MFLLCKHVQLTCVFNKLMMMLVISFIVDNYQFIAFALCYGK